MAMNKALTSLSLRECDVTEAGAMKLREGLASNNTLSNIDLSANKFDMKMWSSLTSRYNPLMTKVVFSSASSGHSMNSDKAHSSRLISPPRSSTLGPDKSTVGGSSMMRDSLSSPPRSSTLSPERYR